MSIVECMLLRAKINENFTIKRVHFSPLKHVSISDHIEFHFHNVKLKPKVNFIGVLLKSKTKSF